MRWIETKQELPKNGEKVLVIVKRKRAGFMLHDVGYYNDGKWWNDMIGELEYDGHNEYIFISHWMPLPGFPL